MHGHIPRPSRPAPLLQARAPCAVRSGAQVPTAHGKSDMGVYRAFGARTLKIIGEVCGSGMKIEKASVDEVGMERAAGRGRWAEGGGKRAVWSECVSQGGRSGSIVYTISCCGVRRSRGHAPNHLII